MELIAPLVSDSAPERFIGYVTGLPEDDFRLSEICPRFNGVDDDPGSPEVGVADRVKDLLTNGRPREIDCFVPPEPVVKSGCCLVNDAWSESEDHTFIGAL